MKFTLVSSGLAALLLGLAHADQTDESKKAFTLRAHSPNQPVDQQVIAATDGGFYIGLAPNVSCNTNNFKCNQYGQTALLIRDYGECVVVDNGQALWDTNAVVVNTTDREFSYGQAPATRGFVYVPDNYTNAHYTPGSFELNDSPGHAVGLSRQG